MLVEAINNKTEAGAPGFSFREALVASERINWRIEDIIGGGKTPDFTKPFMPESLARTSNMYFLTTDERLVLNQIRGHAYLSIFGLVEEFILPFVFDHIRPSLDKAEPSSLTSSGEAACRWFSSTARSAIFGRGA